MVALTFLPWVGLSWLLLASIQSQNSGQPFTGLADTSGPLEADSEVCRIWGSWGVKSHNKDAGSGWLRLLQLCSVEDLACVVLEAGSAAHNLVQMLNSQGSGWALSCFLFSGDVS